MDTKREKLWRSTGISHNQIQSAVFDLQDIARRVEYLHPKLADELEMISHDIEQARKTIQGDAAEMINIDLADSQRFMGETLKALLDKAVD